MSVIPEAGSGCRIICEFVISLSYIVSLMSTWVTSDVLSQNKETKIKTKDYYFLSLILKSFPISQER